MKKAQCCVLLKKDNVYTVSHISHLRETKSRLLLDMAKRGWDYCLENQISVLAKYLPCTSNEIAHWHSRHLRDASLWKLD